MSEARLTAQWCYLEVCGAPYFIQGQRESRVSAWRRRLSPEWRGSANANPALLTEAKQCGSSWSLGSCLLTLQSPLLRKGAASSRLSAEELEPQVVQQSLSRRFPWAAQAAVVRWFQSQTSSCRDRWSRRAGSPHDSSGQNLHSDGSCEAEASRGPASPR